MVADIRDLARLERILGKYHPDIIFHAAAYKHVPLVERYFMTIPETAHEKIFVVSETIPVRSPQLHWNVQKLIRAAQDGEVDALWDLIRVTVPECRSEPVRHKRIPHIVEGKTGETAL